MTNKQLYSKFQEAEEVLASVSRSTMPAGLARAVELAEAMGSARRCLDDDSMAAVANELCGSALGFRTDRDDQPPNGRYSLDVVRDCVIEATIRGLPPVGNLWNIIGGRVYVTREGVQYLLKKTPGFANLKENYGVPKVVGDGAIVECSASWTISGAADSITAEVPIRVNAKMGMDAVLGKAARKLLARVLQRVTGSEVSIPDGDVDDPAYVIVEDRPKLTGSGNLSALKPKPPELPKEPPAPKQPAPQDPPKPEPAPVSEPEAPKPPVADALLKKRDLYTEAVGLWSRNAKVDKRTATSQLNEHLVRTFGLPQAKDVTSEQLVELIEVLSMAS